MMAAERKMVKRRRQAASASKRSSLPRQLMTRSGPPMPDAASGRFEADVGCCNARECLVRSKKSVLVLHHDSAPTRHAAPSPSAVSTCSGRGQRSPPPPSRRHRAQSASHVRKSRRFRRGTRVQPSMWSFPRRSFRTACAGPGIQATSATSLSSVWGRIDFGYNTIFQAAWACDCVIH